MAGNPEVWTSLGLLEHISDIHTKMQDRTFAFILGAGASRTSGIPTGGELVNRWLEELHRRLDAEAGTRSVEEWANPVSLNIDDFDFDNAAEHYPSVFQRRFDHDPDEGFADLESVMEGKSPGLGYAILAKILAETRHKVVVTTNFDSLVADSLYINTQTHPLVVGHESLTGFIRRQMRRPIIAKIHNDLLLNPKNTPDAVDNLTPEWQESLKVLLSNNTPIVLGYGGNDGSLMGFLESMKPGEIAGGIWWCYRKADGLPNQRIQDVVAHHNGRLVPIHGFDEFMFQLQKRLGTTLVVDEINILAKKRIDGYHAQFRTLQTQMSELVEKDEEFHDVRDAVSSSIEEQENWWGWQFKVDAEPDPVEKEAIFRQGIEQFPESSGLIGNFANLLTDFLGKHDEAEKLYKRSIELSPEDADFTGNYALFLNQVREDYDESERLYLQAIRLDPVNAAVHRNYGVFLKEVRQSHDEAESHYKKALEEDANDALNMANYADFLHSIRNEYDEAEKLYKRALELDADNPITMGNYANLLCDVRNDLDGAEELYLRSQELKPDWVLGVRNYAVFMQDDRKDLKKAKELFQRTLELSPDDELAQARLAELIEQGI